MMTHVHPDRSDAGFTLVEMAIVLVIIGLIASMTLRPTADYMASKKEAQTKELLDAAETALINYVSRSKRLPCPADGNEADADQLGTEQGTAGTCLSSQNAGVLPWVTLGIPESGAKDAWGRYLTYRVEPALTDDTIAECGATGLDFSCDPSVADLVTALNGRGLRVCTTGTCPTGTILMNPATGTGAAFVLISAGASGLGAVNSIPAATVAAPYGTLEAPNANLVNIRGLPGATNGYVDLPTSYVRDTATFFDDLVRRPTILNVASRAGLGPRTP